MGSEQSKKGTPVVYNKAIDKTKLEIIVKKIYFTADLEKNRKLGLVAQKEKELLALVAVQKTQRNKDSELAKASAIVSDNKAAKAFECVMRYCDIIKDRALVIEGSKGDPSKINELLPFIESAVWGSKNLNLDCVKELEDFILDSFGPEVHAILSKGEHVQPELKECFDSVLPSESEIKKYLLEFCKKKSIEVEHLNEAGHNVIEKPLVDEKQTKFDGGASGAGGVGGGGSVNTNVNFSPNAGFNPNQYQPQPYQQQQYIPQQYPQQQPYQQPTDQTGGTKPIPTTSTDAGAEKSLENKGGYDFNNDGNSSYPTFKKMEVDPNKGGPKNDLDEFQEKLKNIKEGL